MSILQTYARNFSSAKTSGKIPASSTFNKVVRYAAGAGVVVAAPGLWWLTKPNAITTTTRAEVPRLESPSTGERLDFERGPSKEEVTRMISQGAYSFPVRRIPGVSSYDGTQLASNSPCEDRFIHGRFPSPWKDETEWIVWAVFDGHVGWQTADLLEKHLLPFVRHSLTCVNAASGEEGSVSNEELVRQAIMKGFVNLDDSIIKTALATSQKNTEPLQDKVKKLVLGYSGSCALLSLYDPATSTLHVACSGDSRAVLGHKGPDDSKWEAIALSVDQTGYNEEEVARLNKEHPGEENMIAKDGRVLGMMVSRAFGDGRWKWPLELQQDLKERFSGPTPLTPRYDVRTPPYLTAEPVVTSTKIDPDKPSFLIMATDGLWDTLSSQQAVDLVGNWLESRAAAADKTVISKPGQTVIYEKPLDFGQLGDGAVDWKFVEGRTTIQDDNAAVHLVRNSLGGDHHELIAARLAVGSPFARDLHDDTTVQVVFFQPPGLEGNAESKQP